jgi:hypothetical protein
LGRITAGLGAVGLYVEDVPKPEFVVGLPVLVKPE